MGIDKKSDEKTSTRHLQGVGQQIEKHLTRLAIHSIEDLLLHLPLRYQDRTQLLALHQLRAGQEAVIEGEIKTLSTPLSGKTKLLCCLSDGTGTIYLRFFHKMSFQQNVFKIGTRLRCFGEVRVGPKGIEMFHPEFQMLSAATKAIPEEYLTPVYPATEGISQNVLRKLTAQALTWLQTSAAFAELIPDNLLQTLAMPTLKEALHFVHRPPSHTPLEQATERRTLHHQRLVFEELLAHRLSLLQLKHNFHAERGIPLPCVVANEALFLQQLPFRLTAAQQRVAADIQRDLTQHHPMLRLVQGDVGSGNTVIAALAALQAMGNGYQAAFMAPTELLAEQHYRVFQKWLAPLGIVPFYLSGHIKGKARTAVLKAIAEGEARMVIGTHALFQEDIHFAQLALVITDEQHRFGVAQRALLRKKGVQGDAYPHQLMMTATPIPRTLAMSFYADMDTSSIDELPPGRKPIITSVIPSTRRQEIIARIREACQQGRQAYWVCPLIEESEVLACQSAVQTTADLQALLTELRIDLIHGRMKAVQKEAVMKAFQGGEIHVLVATTVIEVGVDVANASLMIIENAERLGLAQLHQLRGRVGRGEQASYCILLYQVPLSAIATERLKVMRETTNGFEIAERDLELRGPGEVLGLRQTGDFSFYVADLCRDKNILAHVHAAATQLLHNFPEVIEPLKKRWLGTQKDYGKV